MQKLSFYLLIHQEKLVIEKDDLIRDADFWEDPWVDCTIQIAPVPHNIT